MLTFALRDIKVKYAQTFLGIFWVVLQPVPSVVIFTFFFDRLIHVNTGLLPYPIFALTGMVAWNYFTGLSFGIGNSLIESQHILKKVYFPKLILPAAKVLSTGADFMIAFLVVIIAMMFYSVWPNTGIFYFPLFLLFNIITGFTIGIWISALTFRYRDFQLFVPYVINFSIWLTPVFYPTTVLPKELEFIMYFNPMALVIEGYRFSLTGATPPSSAFLYSIALVLVLFLSGVWYFRRIEDEIADFV